MAQALRPITIYANPDKRTIVREVYQARIGTDTVRHGGFKQFYPSGKVESVGRFTDGKPDSVYTEFYENGQRRLEVNWVAGLKEGPFRAWAATGKPMQEGTYRANQQTGPFRTYYPSGKLKMDAEFVDGFPEGLVKAYDSTGTLQSEITYQHHQPNGPTRTFWPGGQVKTVRQYRNGLADGPETTYYESGQVASEIVTKAGTKEGTQRWYFPSGKLQREGAYRVVLIPPPPATYTVAGSANKPKKREMRENAPPAYSAALDGPVTEYFEDGTIAGRTVYKLGARTGTEQFFWPGGKLREETAYANSAHDYDRQQWYASGNLKAEEHVAADLKTGEWRTYFDAAGPAPHTVARYERGRLVGEQLTYFPSGQVASRGSCEVGRRTGIWLEYDGMGAIHSETTYKAGQKNGPYRELLATGAVLVSGSHLAGKQSGKWMWFDTASGTPTRTATFRKGVELPPAADQPKKPVRPAPRTTGRPRVLPKSAGK
ncbi:MAG: toxin-antitoxin system YwqK family antitoxin [Hymenobacteraceae bacterium]|nr:toxin-antitoxin system YwqK family antitoxin [Hymenobacteraceae bacterium]